MDATLDLAPMARAAVDALARRYLWWELPTGSHSTLRAVAQIMNLGTYDDILRLEALVPAEELVQVILSAQPGWFSPRSWEFWRGRLGVGSLLEDKPPTRKLPDDGGKFARQIGRSARPPF